MNSDATKYYYLKDHLGSVRVVINSTNTVVSAQDYDAWGYLLENRSYNATSIKYDFTGKERDAKSNYDYFGARYYDSRIGRWGQVEPLYNDYLSFSPYNYSLNNPILLFDDDGTIPRSNRPMAMPYEGGGWGGVGVGVGVGIVTVALYEATKAFINPIVEAIVKGKVGNLIEEWLENVFNVESTSEGENVETEQSKTKTEETAQEKPQYPVPELENLEPKNKEEWEAPKTPEGNWTKPKSKEYLRPDPKHKGPIGPHTDWRDPSGQTWRIYPDRRVEPKYPGKIK
ncbi:MAG: hypothetical protein L0Y79_10870 [Chlorobi bacterium]|nr:hypothetical protein [Chlorobiota bacterium]MCI0715559.1 hypothetical protein [Chlorobiota bacterium]